MDIPMNVVYACDDRYAMLAGVSMESLYRAHASANICIYVLCNGVSTQNKKRLKDIAARHHNEIAIIEITDDMMQRNDVVLSAQRWTLTAFARLFLAELLPTINRILYLDCDTMILAPLTALYALDLQGHSCAAVAEPFSFLNKRILNMKPDEVYYNSGVMLIELERWRERGISAQFAACLERHNGRVPYVDQGVVNEVLHDDIVCLPAAYNVTTLCYEMRYEEISLYREDRMPYARREMEQAIQKPAIIHFANSFLTPRPWVEGSTHPYAAAWDALLEETAWAGTAKWPDQPGKIKQTCRWIYQHTPMVVGIRTVGTVNSFIRPLLDQLIVCGSKLGGADYDRINGVNHFWESESAIDCAVSVMGVA